MSDPKSKNPNSQNSNSRLADSQPFKFDNKACKKAKRDWRNKSQNYARNRKSKKDSTSATKANVFEFNEPNPRKKKIKDQNCSNRTSCDLIQVKYYNCQNLAHFANNYPELSKN